MIAKIIIRDETIYLFIYLCIYLFIHLFIYLFIYLFSDSWITGYVAETEIQGIMTSQFPRQFQVPGCSISWRRWFKLGSNLAETDEILYSSLKTPNK